METVKSVHAWMVDKIATYPTVTLWLWAASIIFVFIGMWP